MKKSVLALAALSALAGVAHAQSSVTLYGRIDEAYSKRSGFSVPAGINDTQSSRIGFKGVEDLGGGLKALFNLEAGLDTDTGAQADTGKFFNRRAVVGLQSELGAVTLGREYTPSYLLAEKVADPWGNDTYAGFEAIVRGGVSVPTSATGPAGTGPYSAYGTGITNHNSAADSSTGAIDAKRSDNSVTYNLSAAGFNFGAQYAAKEDKNVAGTQYDAATNFGISYGAGPLYVGAGYAAPGTSAPGVGRAEWTSVVGAYDFGFAKFSAFYGEGRNSKDFRTYSWLVAGSAPIGNGQLRVGYGELKNKGKYNNATGVGTAGVKVQEQFSLGYHYSLSKRTTIYTDVVYDDKAGTAYQADGKSKTGYDIGVRHDF